ncbi:hypothetical protein LguiB_003797 [Lonicera macranthoides]
MASFNSDEEEYHFLDAHENIDLISDSDSSDSLNLERPNSSTQIDNGVSSSFNYELWIRSPKSVQERRSEFLKMMGLRLQDRIVGDNNLVDEYGDDFEGESDRIKETSGAVLRSPISEDEFSSSRSSMSSWSDGASDMLQGSSLVGNFICRTGNSDGGAAGEDHLAVVEEYENASGSSPFVVALNKARRQSSLKNRWLRRLRSMTCIVDRQTEDDNLRPNGSNHIQRSRVQRVRVRHRRKRLKELSALFKGQDIPAHDGSILTMRFSLDGQYLASAGKDGIVRVWQVVETERSNQIDIPEIEPSCLYFTVNQLSELASLVVEKETSSNIKSIGKTSDSACVVFPPKVFRILEKPLHEFHGHSGDILDLSWSPSNCLLSSSVDKTVRLWRVGCNQCLRVFSHSNYVTCVQFNPVDDNYFISGSIDGKVRIWVINGCHVVDWTDIRDIVTAVSYRPDGQGGIGGSMAGHCYFFNLSGPQNAGNQLSAFFTTDGKHIVSACDDSNVYVWNCINPGQPKTDRSFECFTSNGSVAIPWSGLKVGNSQNQHELNTLDKDSPSTLPFSPSTCFSLGQEYVESVPKGSATWPEEKLPSSSPRAVSSAMHKSHYKFLKSSYQNSYGSHAWGLVIVTAGWDGRIRSFLNYGLPLLL